MAEPTDLRALARWRMAVNETARATMAGAYDRQPVSRSHPIGNETVRLSPAPVAGSTIASPPSTETVRLRPSWSYAMRPYIRFIRFSVEPHPLAKPHQSQSHHPATPVAMILRL